MSIEDYESDECCTCALVMVHAIGRLLNISISFFFNDTATTEIYTLSLHDALPISLYLTDKTMSVCLGKRVLLFSTFTPS